MLPNRAEIVFAKGSDIEPKFINSTHAFRERQVVQIAQRYVSRRFLHAAAQCEADVIRQNLAAADQMLFFRRRGTIIERRCFSTCGRTSE